MHKHEPLLGNLKCSGHFYCKIKFGNKCTSDKTWTYRSMKWLYPHQIWIDLAQRVICIQVNPESASRLPKQVFCFVFCEQKHYLALFLYEAQVVASPPFYRGDINLHKQQCAQQWLTCRYEEDPCTQDDIVSAPVKLTGCHAEPPHEQQTHTHDGEDAGGTHSTWTHGG